MDILKLIECRRWVILVERSRFSFFRLVWSWWFTIGHSSLSGFLRSDILSSSVFFQLWIIDFCLMSHIDSLSEAFRNQKLQLSWFYKSLYWPSCDLVMFTLMIEYYENNHFNITQYLFSFNQLSQMTAII